MLIFQDKKENVKARYLGRQDPSRPGEDAALFEERWKQYHENVRALRSMFEAKGWEVRVSSAPDYEVLQN